MFCLYIFNGFLSFWIIFSLEDFSWQGNYWGFCNCCWGVMCVLTFKKVNLAFLTINNSLTLGIDISINFSKGKILISCQFLIYLTLARNFKHFKHQYWIVPVNEWHWICSRLLVWGHTYLLKMIGFFFRNYMKEGTWWSIVTMKSMTKSH